MILLIIEGLIIGALLGLTGAGGGILAVPALMASQGWTVAQAAPVGLLAVTLSALLGTVQGLIKKIVRYRAALWIAVTATPMAHIGVWIANRSSPGWLTLAFSLVMFYVAYRLLSNQVTDFANPPCRINPQTGKLIWSSKTATVLGGIGLLAGLLTGLLGVGGGFVIVPALKKTTNLDMHSIVATSLMIIFLIGSLSIGIHILDGFHYPLQTSLVFVLSCIAGLFAGRQIIMHVSDKSVQILFAYTVLFVAVYMLARFYMQMS